MSKVIDRKPESLPPTHEASARPRVQAIFAWR